MPAVQPLSVPLVTHPPHQTIRQQIVGDVSHDGDRVSRFRDAVQYLDRPSKRWVARSSTGVHVVDRDQAGRTERDTIIQAAKVMIAATQQAVSPNTPHGRRHRQTPTDADQMPAAGHDSTTSDAANSSRVPIHTACDPRWPREEFAASDVVES